MTIAKTDTCRVKKEFILKVHHCPYCASAESVYIFLLMFIVLPRVSEVLVERVMLYKVHLNMMWNPTHNIAHLSIVLRESNAAHAQ